MRVITACFGVVGFTIAILAISKAPPLAYWLTSACFIACALIFYFTRSRAGPRPGSQTDPP